MNQDPKLIEALSALVQGMQVTASVIQALIADATQSDKLHASSSCSATPPESNQLQALPRKWKQLGSQWPQIGGVDFAPVPRDIFMSSAFRDAYRPGETRTCYVAKCHGLDRLSQTLQVPLNKVSTCEDGRLHSRLGELSREQYGSIIKRDGKLIAESGFAQWSTYRPPRSLRASPNSPVIITADAIGVVMPDTMSKEEFDEGYDGYIAQGSLNNWIGTGDGIGHCAKLQMEPYHGIRYSHRHRRLVVEAAREFAVFRARGDYERLVAIVERVIIDHLRLAK